MNHIQGSNGIAETDSATSSAKGIYLWMNKNEFRKKTIDQDGWLGR